MTTRRHVLKMALAGAAALNLPEMPVASAAVAAGAERPPVPGPGDAGAPARPGVSPWDELDPPDF